MAIRHHPSFPAENRKPLDDALYAQCKFELVGFVCVPIQTVDVPRLQFPLSRSGAVIGASAHQGSLKSLLSSLNFDFCQLSWLINLV